MSGLLGAGQLLVKRVGGDLLFQSPRPRRGRRDDGRAVRGGSGGVLQRHADPTAPDVGGRDQSPRRTVAAWALDHVGTRTHRIQLLGGAAAGLTPKYVENQQVSSLSDWGEDTANLTEECGFRRGSWITKQPLRILL
ncbi:hypothetical protein MSMEG_4369 [Mycolicibacterium smegmatis MC2 155]|uniref:Uncharacterized protein n=1 Tax=Mycolicibacterium smegmatis (strain ATCC 700084 / mc(2)155) TaxID=246196 RepID=A0R0F5_MYCS2|nr:hypothetical protein MSMEG_4369 [Mycolicibacterium smegmatis MC2 155]